MNSAAGEWLGWCASARADVSKCARFVFSLAFRSGLRSGFDSKASVDTRVRA